MRGGTCDRIVRHFFFLRYLINMEDFRYRFFKDAHSIWCMYYENNILRKIFRSGKTITTRKYSWTKMADREKCTLSKGKELHWTLKFHRKQGIGVYRTLQIYLAPSIRKQGTIGNIKKACLKSSRKSVETRKSSRGRTKQKIIQNTWLKWFNDENSRLWWMCTKSKLAAFAHYARGDAKYQHIAAIYI